MAAIPGRTAGRNRNERRRLPLHRRHWRYGVRAMSENFSLIVMCVFLLASLAFLAEQITSYH
jgi:hypothetical protein